MLRRSAPLWMLACLSLLAASPLAAAHGTAHDSALWLGNERVLITVSGAPIPVAGVPLSLLVVLPAREGAQPPEVLAQLTPPSGAAGEARVMRFYNGTHALAVNFAEAGEWRLVVRVGGESVEDSIHVHPEGEVFVTADERLAARSVLVAGEPEKVSLRVANVHGMPVGEARDAVARVETWDPAGGVLRDVEEVPAVALNESVYEFVRTWDDPALVRITLTSGEWSLDSGDRPPVEVLVVPSEESSIYRADPEARTVPLVGFGWTLAALAAGVVALAWRRRS